MIQLLFDLVGLALAALLLYWMWNKFFNKTKNSSEVLSAKRNELEELRQRKEELENLVGVTTEVVSIQKRGDLHC